MSPTPGPADMPTSARAWRKCICPLATSATCPQARPAPLCLPGTQPMARRGKSAQGYLPTRRGQSALARAAEHAGKAASGARR